MPELRQLFNTKSYGHGGKRKGGACLAGGSKKRIQQKTWTHTFVCLGDPDDVEPPDGTERAKLLLAGLGEKKINLTYGDIRNDLFEEYPKLKAGGGFELLRIRHQSRDLEPIPIPHGGYTVEYLKTVVQNAKIFIRPIQAPLDVTVNPCSSEVCQLNCCLNVIKMIQFIKKDSDTSVFPCKLVLLRTYIL